MGGEVAGPVVERDQLPVMAFGYDDAGAVGDSLDQAEKVEGVEVEFGAEVGGRVDDVQVGLGCDVGEGGRDRRACFDVGHSVSGWVSRRSTAARKISPRGPSLP